MSAGRILVVDDDPQIRRVMRVTLTGQGYEVDDVKSGEARAREAARRAVDLVLLDMNMAGMGGVETCRAIREQSEIAIIMLTVRESEFDKVDALDAGADDYVTKLYNAPSSSRGYGRACGGRRGRTAGRPNDPRFGRGYLRYPPRDRPRPQRASHPERVRLSRTS